MTMPSPPRRRARLDEDNPLVPCACACGETLSRFDALGRARAFLPGHNRRGAPRPAPARALVLATLAEAAPETGLPVAQIAARTGLSPAHVASQLSALRALRLAGPRSPGVWAAGATLESGSDPSGDHQQTPDLQSVPPPRQDNCDAAPREMTGRVPQ